MILLVLLSIFVLIILRILSEHQNYFKNRRIPYLHSVPLLGAFKDNLLGRKSIYECTLDIYNNPKLKNEPFFGIFIFHEPALFVKDAKLIKDIMVKDANFFSDRRLSTDKKDPLHSNVFTVTNPDWSRIRKKLSPIFTSAKFKAAFCHFDQIAKLFAAHIDQKVKNGENEINVSTLCPLYTIDVSSNIFYGFNPRSLEGNHDELHEALYSITKLTPKRSIEFFAFAMMPVLFKIMKLEVLGSRFTTFVRRLIPRALDEREQSGLKRNDFLDMLLELRKSRQLTSDEICAQAAAFFVGGFETTSNTLAFFFRAIALNPQVQQKLRDEIRKYFDENEDISYETVAHSKALPYLECVIKETLRMHSIAPYIDRVCVNPDGYSLEPMSDFRIPFGFSVVIPFYALCFDEKVFEDPWTFKPERFEKGIPQDNFLPFGLGPRNCIGERFAWFVMKTGILRVLKDFRVEKCDSTIERVDITIRSWFNKPQKEIILKFIKDEMK